MNPNPFDTVCVYCGSADGLDEIYYRSARQMGNEIARAGLQLVYGAGKTGLMGAVAGGVLEAGGRVIGVIPENLNTPQLVHGSLTSLEVVSDIQVRKARMSALADAFIALPGGFGTFDELFETLTWAQIGLHHKPIGLLNTRGYFNPMLEMVEHARKEKFIYPEHCNLVLHDEDPAMLLKKLRAFQPPQGLERWVNR